MDFGIIRSETPGSLVRYFSSLADCLIGVDTDGRTVSRLCFRNSERVIRLDMCVS